MTSSVQFGDIVILSEDPASISRMARFWAKVPERSHGCWEWTSSRARGGYGLFWQDGRYQMAHRVVWKDTVGPIPEGLEVCHRCDNPPCVRPAHLFLATHAENIADKVRKGRAAAGDRNGARLYGRLTWEDVRAIRDAAVTGTAQLDIAARYRVNPSHISRIVSRHVWKES